MGSIEFFTTSFSAASHILSTFASDNPLMLVKLCKNPLFKKEIINTKIKCGLKENSLEQRGPEQRNYLNRVCSFRFFASSRHSGPISTASASNPQHNTFRIPCSRPPSPPLCSSLQTQRLWRKTAGLWAGTSRTSRCRAGTKSWSKHLWTRPEKPTLRKVKELQ